MVKMVVMGFEVGEDVVAAIISRMQNGNFVAGELEAIAIKMGVPEEKGTAMRVADRLIQREKKAGNAVFARPTWDWVGPK